MKANDEIDYKDPYNQYIIWKSIGCPYKGTWKTYADDIHYRRLEHQLGAWDSMNIIDNTERIMGRIQLLRFTVIINSDSYVHGLVDCISLISKHLQDIINQYLDNYRENRCFALFPYKQMWGFKDIK